MIRFISVSAAVLTLAVGAFAQTQQISAGNLHRTVAPTHGVYNMTTGFEVNAQSFRSGPATIFDNTDGVTYYFSTLSDTEEWIDSCAFVADEINGMEQINGFDFSYCSQFADVTGDAITTEVRFYDDNPGFMEPTGWSNLGTGTIQNATCAYGIAGLPGDTSLTGISCWTIEIELMCGFECSVPQEITPGGITEFNGIGWMYMDGFGGSNTGPFLGSTIGPGGPGTAIPGYGSRDLFEWMELAFAPGGWAGTFFGGGPKAQATFNVVLYGDGILDTDVVNANAPDVGDVLCLGSDVEFRSGNAVTWALDDLGGTAVFPSSAYAMLVGTNGASAGFGSLAGPGTTLLVDPGSLLFPPTPLVMSGAIPAVTTPSLPGLPPTIWAQAMGFNGGVGPGNAAEASNALRHNN